MKNNLILIFLLSLSSTILYSQPDKEVSLSYNPGDFIIDNVDGKAFITSSDHSLHFMSDSLAPALPYIAVKVLVGSNSQYAGFSHSETEQLFASNIDMAPNPIEVPTNIAQLQGNTYNTEFPDSVYPSEPVIYAGTQTMDGYHYMSFLVCPFRYDVENRQLFFHPSCTISINFSTVSNAPGYNLTETAGSVMRDVVQGMVFNPEEMDNLYGAPTSPSSDDYKYLIVTSNALKPVFQTLADWKTQKGVKAKVLTTEEIDNNYTGATQQLRIKKALKDYYNGTHRGLKYALLGGGVSVIPAQYCCVVASNIKEDTPSDLFYACFDTMDWDTCEKGEYGELKTNVDIAPDITVTRLPAVTASEAETMVNRIIAYEKNPNCDNWEDKILMSGSMISKYYNNNTVSDAQYQCDSIYTTCIAPYWSGQRVRLFDTDTDFTGGGDYELNSEHLHNELRKGYSLVYMNTHGNPGSWILENGYYDYNMADTLHNSKMDKTVVIATSCYTNGFDYPHPFLSGSFLKNPYSGVLAYCGSSRSGWSISYKTEWAPSNKLNIALLHDLFTSDNHGLGDALSNAKSFYSDIGIVSNNCIRWLIFSVNMMGDPEMPVYLSRPKKLTPLYVRTYVEGNKDHISVSGTGYYRITVMSKGDNGASYYDVREHVKHATFDQIPSGCNVCITRPGYIPYIFDYHRLQIVQNNHWSIDKDIIADSVLIGSDVAKDTDFGPVSIEGGKTIISSNSLNIKNDFEVKLGAELEINTVDDLAE